MPISECIETISTLFDAFISSRPKSKTVLPHAKRSLGAASEIGLALLGAVEGYKKELKPLYGRLIVLLNGYPNYGPGCLVDDQEQQVPCIMITYTDRAKIITK